MASAFSRFFLNDSDVIVFASGVSNSKESSADEFLREKIMLVEALAEDKLIVYFSTCSINDPELQGSAYVLHKIDMEDIVKSSKRFAIFRLPQVVGKTSNPNTLTNYLFRQIMTGNKFQVWLHAKRNLIDVDDVAAIANYLIRSKQVDMVTMNIASPFTIFISDLVEIFEATLRKKANYEVVSAGGTYLIDSSLATRAAKNVGVIFDENYAKRVVEKYYANQVLT